MPVDRIVGVLLEIRTGLLREPVRHDSGIIPQSSLAFLDLGHFDKPNAVRRPLYRRDKRGHHRADRHEPEPQGELARRRQTFREPIAGNERVRPPMPRSQARTTAGESSR